MNAFRGSSGAGKKYFQEEFQPLTVNYSAKALNRTFAARADYYPRLGLPFAIFGDPAVETYVLSRGQLQPEYTSRFVGVYTAEALERKLRDVARTEYLLVPQGFASHSPRNRCADDLAR